MKTEDLLEVISEVDDELLERSEKVKTGNKGAWKKWLPLAACACLIVVIGVAGMKGLLSPKMGNDSAAPSDDMPASDDASDVVVEDEAYGDAETADDTSEPDKFTTEMSGTDAKDDVSQELDIPEDVEMTIVKQRDNIINVRFDNKSDQVWEYGEFYSLQVLVDGTWSDVPTLPGEWAFETIADSLPAGESVEKAYNLGIMYGELSTGTYRIVVEGLTAEFEIK